MKKIAKALATLLRTTNPILAGGAESTENITLSVGKTVDGKDISELAIADISGIPGTIASILTDHDKAAHDALDIAPASHGADKHTDRTRELFIPCTFATDGITIAGANLYHVGGKLTDEAEKSAYAISKTPEDFVSGGIIKAVVLADGGSGNIRYDIHVKYAANNEWCEQHADVVFPTEAISNLYIEILSGVSLTLLAKGDVMGIKFTREADHVDDTVDADVYLLGFIFEYTADM